MGVNTDLRARSARDLGSQFTQNDHRMVGTDGAYSFAFDNGAVWYFGDTFIGERRSGEPMPHGLHLEDYAGIGRMVTNAGAIVRDETGREGLQDVEFITDDRGEIRQLVEPLASEADEDSRLWCLDGCILDGTVYLYYIKIEIVPPTTDLFPLGFELGGSGLAKGEPGAWRFQRLEAEGETMWWPKTGEDVDPHFASAALVDPHSEYLYVYGADKTAVEGDRCFLGRVPRTDIETPAAYTYFDGNGWTQLLSAAEPVFDGMPNEMSVSYNAYLDAYLAVYTLGHTGQIVGRTAATPWGPWSDPAILWSIEPVHGSIPTDVPTYAGKEHPELAGDGGRTIYVTYVEFDEYYPHLVEIRLA